MDHETDDAETQPTPQLMATPHPLWLGGILLMGGVLGAADGQWGLALLFFAFSGAVVVGGTMRLRRARVKRDGAGAPPASPPQ